METLVLEFEEDVIYGPNCRVHLVHKEYCKVLKGGGSKGEGYLT